MLSRAKIKEIQSLEIKKYRDEKRLFVAEGHKLVSLLMASFSCEYLIAPLRWLETQDDIRAKEVIEGQED